MLLVSRSPCAVRASLSQSESEALQEGTAICYNTLHILYALQPSLLTGRTAAMSNPAFEFDHIHIISQSPHDSANWYVQMFGAEIVADTVARGAPQIFLEIGGKTLTFPYRDFSKYG